MKIRRLGAVVLALMLGCLLSGGVLAAVAAAATATEAGAKAYVQGLYYRYEHEELFGVLGDHQGDFFDASTVALLDQNTKLLNGELGELDSDPLCACQDPGGMKAEIQAVKMTGAGTARVSAVVRFGGDSANAPRLAVDLAFANGQWRIHDVKNGNYPSLREILIKENRELSAAAHH